MLRLQRERGHGSLGVHKLKWTRDASSLWDYPNEHHLLLLPWILLLLLFLFILIFLVLFPVLLATSVSSSLHKFALSSAYTILFNSTAVLSYCSLPALFPFPSDLTSFTPLSSFASSPRQLTLQGSLPVSLTEGQHKLAHAIQCHNQICPVIPFIIRLGRPAAKQMNSPW